MSTEVQKKQAGDFFRFMNSVQSDLRDLNGDDKFFTALVAVTDTNKVKLIYGLGVGTAGIGQVSAVVGKLLALFGEGGGALGPAQSIMLDATIKDHLEMKNITADEVGTVFGQSSNESPSCARYHNCYEDCANPSVPRLGWIQQGSRRSYDLQTLDGLPARVGHENSCFRLLTLVHDWRMEIE